MLFIKKNSYLSILILVLFVFMAFTSVSIWFFQKNAREISTIKQQETKRIEAKLLVFQAYVKKTLEKYDYIAQDLANRKQLGNMDNELKRLQSLDSKIMDMLYINRSGYIQHWTRSGSRPIVSDREYYSKIKNSPLTTRYISSAQAFRVHGKSLFFSISRPILNNLGEFDGVLAVLVAIESLIGDLEKQLSVGDSHFAIFNEDGAPLMRLPMMNDTLGLAISTPPSEKSNSGSIIHLNRKSQFSGSNRRTAWVYLPNYELWAVITEPQKNIEQIIDSNVKNNLVLIVFTFIFLIVLFVSIFIILFKSKQRYTVLYNSKEKLKSQAERDPLTNLYNRRYLNDYAKNEITKMAHYDNQICIVVVDIDNFKLINDSYGHSLGDQVLLSVANCLNDFKRSSDCIVRYGGEEFVILLPNITEKQSCQYAELIRTRIEKLHVNNSKQCSIPVTVSIGLSLVNREETSIELAFQRADSALYEAKNSGKNCFKIK